MSHINIFSCKPYLRPLLQLWSTQLSRGQRVNTFRAFKAPHMGSPSTSLAWRSPSFILSSPTAAYSNLGNLSHASAPTRLSRKPALGRLLSQPLKPIRRRRAVLCAAQPQNSDASDKDDQPSDTDNRINQDDKTASDLALPDLQKLFYEKGDPDCQQCEGEGVITCPVCNGTGFLTLTMMDQTSSTTCRMCKGRRLIPCPSCRTLVFKSVLWWDQIPSEEDDPDETWRTGPDGQPRFPWGGPPHEV